jgi:helicase-like protein
LTQPSAVAGAAFVRWLSDQLVADARGSGLDEADFAPAGRLWLGRLAPEATVQNSRLGERAERLDPCACGIRVLPTDAAPRTVSCRVSVRAWKLEQAADPHGAPAVWKKSAPISVDVELRTPAAQGQATAAGRSELSRAFANAGFPGLTAEVRAELEPGKQGLELVVTVVNVSPEEIPSGDSNLYEVALTAGVGDTTPFMLDDLPDTFRYSREVAAYGVNGGVDVTEAGAFVTSDVSAYEQPRPSFWDADAAGPVPDLSFASLAGDPRPAMMAIVDAMYRWGGIYWADQELERRAARENWSEETIAAARAAADEWLEEIRRLEGGLTLLDESPGVLRAFSLMNAAFAAAPGIRHSHWRPFQVGFMLGSIESLVGDSASRDLVDILRFPTGGGKTETYLGLLVTAAFLDRLTGKGEGVTGWARFPLRMLSLQQTQRFADVFAAAELIRQSENLGGAPFSVGFLVGPGTPNDIKPNPSPGEPDSNDPDMPQRYQVLLHCPFCNGDKVEMRFDKASWRLEHACPARGCPWRGPLPFFIVDQELFRFLPTVVVGTLDKAAVISLQAAMRGLYSAPLGLCPNGHGYTYAKRSKSPSGCLFPGCTSKPIGLPQPESLYPPGIRIQDELHLLRDSLGAVDAHYEGLLDQLQGSAGKAAKVLASSATIEGYRRQVDVLYRRSARVFPLPGPVAGRSFWASDTTELARLFVGLAPRGTTIDYAADRATESLQRAVRRVLTEPDEVAAEASVDEAQLPFLLSYYGTDVVYGSTLKDVEASARSFETQFDIQANAVTLTGRTPLDDVRGALKRLVTPEPEYDKRIHLVAASSMLSHGVDVDRLNIMVMLGLPLATAEFIQTSSRVGRSVPGLVLVLHKIGRERDHKVFRTFRQFVANADRLVDAVPITRRSRRVLELTFPGLVMGRILGVHEPEALKRGLDALTTPPRFRTAIARLGLTEDAERALVEAMLGATEPLDEGLRTDIATYMRDFFRAALDPVTTARFTSELLTKDTMRSLRDVEAQVPVYSRGGTR